MKKRISRIRQWEHGQAVLEFALSIPIILLIIFATIDAGWYFLNSNALKTTAKNAVYEMKEPVYADWSTGGDWTYGGRPSWAGTNELTQYDEYDAWLPFGLVYAGDSPAELKDRVQEKSGLIDLNDTNFVIKGGWLLRTMAENIPDTNGTNLRTTPRTAVYYVDVSVRIEYDYHPFTFVGNLIFCGGRDVKTLTATERVTYQMGSAS